MQKLAYTVPEAVEASGLGRTKIYEFFKSGLLHRRKVGRRTLILADDLKALLESLPEEAA